MGRSKPVTTTDLVSQVRSQIDEVNRTAVDTEDDILPALNRATGYGVDILARKYPAPLMASHDISLSGSTTEYDIPEDALGDRVLKAEINVGSYSYEVTRVPIQEKSRYESGGKSQIPWVYYIVGRKLIFLPSPSGTYPARLYYLREPEELMPVWGRITKTGADYIVVDSLGDDDTDTEPTTDSTSMDSYINAIDAHTGVVKATAQVKVISGSRVTLKSIPSRSSVWGRTISSASDFISALSLDDYICQIGGSCVPSMEYPLNNFVIQFATAELRRKLGESSELEWRVMQDFERQVEKMWSGRESGERVQRKRHGYPWPIISDT